MSHFALRTCRLSMPACTAATLLLILAGTAAVAAAADHPGRTTATNPKALEEQDVHGARWRQAAVPWTGTDSASDARARVAANPRDPAGYVELAGTLCRAGEYGDAARVLEEGRDKCPPSAELLYRLGAIYAQQDKLADAEATTQAALQVEPRHVAAHCQLGMLYVRLGWQESAVESYERALAIEPGNLLARCGLVGALIEANRAPTAEKVCRGYLEKSPKEADLWIALGEALEARDDAKGAFASYGRALAENPGSADAHARRGRLFCNGGQFEAAQNECRAALAIEPGHALAHAYLGVACAFLGQKEEARRHAVMAEQAGLHMEAVWHKLGE